MLHRQPPKVLAGQPKKLGICQGLAKRCAQVPAEPRIRRRLKPRQLLGRHARLDRNRLPVIRHGPHLYHKPDTVGLARPDPSISGVAGREDARPGEVPPPLGYVATTVRRAIDRYSRDYVKWATQHQPYSWGLELVGFVALIALVRVVVGSGVIFWVIAIPIMLMLAVWAVTVSRNLRCHP